MHGARQLLQKRREASFKRFKAISKIWLHFNFSKQPTVLNKLLMNNRHVFAWCIRLWSQIWIWMIHQFSNVQRNYSKLQDTFPLGRPNSLSAWKITFSVLPDAKVLVMLKQKSGGKRRKNVSNILNIQFSLSCFWLPTFSSNFNWWI